MGRVEVGGGIFLALSCKKDSFGKLNSLKDRRCFMRCLSLFFVRKGAYGNIRDKVVVLRGQSRASTVRSTGSFARRKDKDLQEN